ncbi:MAG: hypothetical protein GXP39_10295 [Chloroflexi bacterium]|nr:hypothetical protein [Chloroflexota bacterium]
MAEGSADENGVFVFPDLVLTTYTVFVRGPHSLTGLASDIWRTQKPQRGVEDARNSVLRAGDANADGRVTTFDLFLPATTLNQRSG